MSVQAELEIVTVPTPDLTGPEGWHPMDTAPKDGSEIVLLIEHVNYQYASEKDKPMWREECPAAWTDSNGGGWVWRGLCGTPIGWKSTAA